MDKKQRGINEDMFDALSFGFKNTGKINIIAIDEASSVVKDSTSLSAIGDDFKILWSQDVSNLGTVEMLEKIEKHFLENCKTSFAPYTPFTNSLIERVAKEEEEDRFEQLILSSRQFMIPTPDHVFKPIICGTESYKKVKRFKKLKLGRFHA